MSKLKLTLACEDYDRTRPLKDGTVVPEGIDLNVITVNNPERHTRMMQHLEFDVCELSTAQFLTGKTRGMPVTAIPAFPHRLFRHGFIFVNTAAGISKPQDLAGKRIGVSLYMNTAAMWIRGILDDEYGVKTNQITWVTDLAEEVKDWKPPAGLVVERRPLDKSLDEALVSGFVDAVIYPTELPSVRSGNPKVGRLFPDYANVEVDYYKRTKLFPIMHTIVIKDSVLQDNPWVAPAMLKAFDRALQAAVAYHKYEGRTILVSFSNQLEQQREIMGPNPYTYGLKANRYALEKMVEYAYNQALIERKVAIEELFAPNAHEPWPEFKH